MLLTAPACGGTCHIALPLNLVGEAAIHGSDTGALAELHATQFLLLLRVGRRCSKLVSSEVVEK